MKIMNWCYRAYIPQLNLERVNQQMWLAHRYRNALIEIERWRLAEAEKIRERLIPGLKSAKAEYEAADATCQAHAQAVKSRNAQARDKAATAADRSETKRLTDARKAAYLRVRECKAQQKGDDYAAAMSQLQDDFNAKWREARAASGVWYGTYMLVDEHARASFKTCQSTFPYEPPQFRNWEGHGAVAIQSTEISEPGVPCGIPIGEILSGTCSKLRIEKTPSANDGRLQAKNLYDVFLRIGSNVEDGRSPIWTKFAIRMHRPIPSGAIVKWAVLERERIGCSLRWQLRLTIACPAESLKPKVRASTGTVGVDVGWRKVPSGLRVAYWVGSDGQEGELIIPTSRIEQMRKPDELQSIRDRGFTDILSTLAPWAKSNGPAWMAERTKTIHLWMAQGKLAALALFWRDNRFPGDETIYDLVEAWRKQDKHLCNWEGFGRATGWRQEMYREFAANLRKNYARVVIEDTDWRVFARKAPADSNEHDIAEIRWNNRRASCGELSEILREFGFADEVQAELTTQKCSTCGHIEAFDAARELIHTWACGHTHDQDRNAAINLRDTPASGDVVAETPDPSEPISGQPVARKNTAAAWREASRKKRAARKADGK